MTSFLRRFRIRSDGTTAAVARFKFSRRAQPQEPDMMKSLFSAFLLATLALGCAARQKFMDNCPGISSVDSSRIAVAMDIKTVAGGAPFALGETEHAQSGIEYKIS